VFQTGLVEVWKADCFDDVEIVKNVENQQFYSAGGLLENEEKTL
jgi:hypothetical protein